MKNAKHTFPEIDALNLEQVRSALRIGANNLASVTSEFKPELLARMAALEERKQRLEKMKLQLDWAQLKRRRKDAR